MKRTSEWIVADIKVVATIVSASVGKHNVICIAVR